MNVLSICRGFLYTNIHRGASGRRTVYNNRASGVSGIFLIFYSNKPVIRENRE
jgi:hypothetical protein